jgi:hypothetical protein
MIMIKKSIKNIYRFLSPKFQTLFLEYKVNLKPRKWEGKDFHPNLYEIINKNRALYAEILEYSLKHKETLQNIKVSGIETDTTKPVYNNGYLPGLDIVGIYTMISRYKPSKYIEVGSGNSTKVAFKAIRENNLNTKIISIDPKPRTEIDSIADVVIREPFENTNLDLILSLKENDILFIDNSHRILPNSDSMVFFLEVLPRLAKGVVIHIHDIYLPYDYPEFMCERFYSEQYGLAIYLLANSQRYQPILPNFFISRDEELSKILNPIWSHPALKEVEKHGGSFWLRIE